MTLKICLLSDTFPPDPGGLAVSVARLARGIVASGHQVYVCLPDKSISPGQTSQIVTDDGLIVYRLGAHKRIDDTRAAWFEAISRWHRQEAFDILHGYYLVGAGFVTVYAGRYLGIPTVVSARGNDLDRTVLDPSHAGGIIWALGQAGAVTTVSQDLGRKARALAPGCAPQCIHNGVDSQLFTPAAADRALRASLGLRPDSPVLGFVGEARLKKGLTILLPAFAQVAAQRRQMGQPAPGLLLVGGVRRDDQEIVRVFRAQHPQLKLRLIPYLEHGQLPPYYQLLDLLLLPSLRDGLPNSLLEGMACGCATIASNVGGIPDVVRDGQNGLLIPPGDGVALVSAINQLIDQSAERDRLGKEARQTILNQFTLVHELQANLALYQALTR